MDVLFLSISALFFFIKNEADETKMNLHSLLSALAGFKSNETDSDEIISAKSLLMTTANISYKSHRRRCVVQWRRYVQFAKWDDLTSFL